MGMFDAGRAILRTAKLYDETITSYSRDRVVLKENVACKIAQTRNNTNDAGYWDTMTQHSYRMDFIVEASALGTVPQVRDVILWRGSSFAVVEMNGESCYTFHDRLCNVYRIHAEAAITEVAPEPEPEPEPEVQGGEP